MQTLLPAMISASRQNILFINTLLHFCIIHMLVYTFQSVAHCEVFLTYTTEHKHWHKKDSIGYYQTFSQTSVTLKQQMKSSLVTDGRNPDTDTKTVLESLVFLCIQTSCEKHTHIHTHTHTHTHTNKQTHTHTN